MIDGEDGRLNVLSKYIPSISNSINLKCLAFFATFEMSRKYIDTVLS